MIVNIRSCQKYVPSLFTVKGCCNLLQLQRVPPPTTSPNPAGPPHMIITIKTSLNTSTSLQNLLDSSMIFSNRPNNVALKNIFLPPDI